MIAEKKDRYCVAIVFAIFLIILLLQYCQVFFYHDDYGYASWSYCRDSSFENFWDFIKFHYHSINGRVTGALLLSTVPHIGLSATRIFISICICITYILLYVLSTPQECSRNYGLDSICCIMCFGIFSLDLYSGCLFWFSAAYMYIIPMMLFLICVYIQNKKYSKTLEWILFYFCAVFATLGQEIISVGILSYSILRIIISIIIARKIRVSDIIFPIISFISLATMLLSSGNHSRMESAENTAFYALPIWAKIKMNIPYIFRKIFNPESRLFDGYFELCSIICCLLNIKHKDKKFWKFANVLCLISCVVMLVGEIINSEGYYEHIHNHVSIYNLLILFQFILLLVPIFNYLFRQKAESPLLLAISGLISLAALCIAPPDTHPRACIFFIFTILLILIFVIRNVSTGITSKSIRYVLSIGLCIMPTLNYAKVFNGYYKNAPINRNNDKLLIEAAKNSSQEIILTKLVDDRYSDFQPYNCPYILIWIKEYYHLDKNTTILYEENPNRY